MREGTDDKWSGNAAGQAATLAAGGQELVVGHVSKPPSWIAYDDAPRRNVSDHDSSCSDESLFSDLDAGKDHGAAADSRATTDCGTSPELMPSFGASHEVVVRGDYAWSDEHVVLDSRIRSDIGVCLDRYALADDRVVFDE